MGIPLNTSYESTENGGVLITICQGTEPGGPHVVTLDMDHHNALMAAGAILFRAGVARAEYEDGRLQEMARP